MSLSEVKRLKARADDHVWDCWQTPAEDRRHCFFHALEDYTAAIDMAVGLSEEPKELVRITLFERARAYLQYGDIHDALRDVELALSDRYTTPDSSRVITWKLYGLYSDLLSKFSRYDEVAAAMARWIELWDIRHGHAADPRRVMAETRLDILRQRITAYEENPTSQVARKAALMRAVDSRGIILANEHRVNFPAYQIKKMLTSTSTTAYDVAFADGDSDSNGGIGIRIPVHIYATLLPHWKLVMVNGLGAAWSELLEAQPETRTIGQILAGKFRLVGNTMLRAGGRGEEVALEAYSYEEENETAVIVRTYRGRFLEIPRATTLRELWDGARQLPGPFPVLSTAERRGIAPGGTVDGVHLSVGSELALFVIPRKAVQRFVTIAGDHSWYGVFAF